LITPGAVSGTPFARFPGLARLVTHIVAPSYRQASRVANTMYFARACRSFAEAREASVFLICDEARVELVERAWSDWRHKTVLLALAEPEAAAARFREYGASVATVIVVDEVHPCRFFVEGDDAAVVVAKKLFESVRGEVGVTSPGSRHHIEAMRLLAGPILMGVLESANLHLRRSGLPLEEIRSLLGRFAAQTLRVHQRSGARTWRATNTRELAVLLARLAEADPQLAAHLHASESATRALIEPEPEPVGTAKRP